MRLAIHAPNLGLIFPINLSVRMWPTVVCTPPWQPTAASSKSAFARRTSRRQQFFSDSLGLQPVQLSSRWYLTQTLPAAQAGTLLRGQPYLSELAWERGHLHGHQAYSLVGMIHLWLHQGSGADW